MMNRPNQNHKKNILRNEDNKTSAEHRRSKYCRKIQTNIFSSTHCNPLYLLSDLENRRHDNDRMSMIYLQPVSEFSLNYTKSQHQRQTCTKHQTRVVMKETSISLVQISSQRDLKNFTKLFGVREPESSYVLPLQWIRDNAFSGFDNTGLQLVNGRTGTQACLWHMSRYTYALHMSCV